MVVQEASTELVSIPATYETVSETIVVTPQSVEYVSIPATYETVQEAVVVQEASRALKCHVRSSLGTIILRICALRTRFGAQKLDLELSRHGSSANLPLVPNQ